MIPFYREIQKEMGTSMALENFEKGWTMELEVKAEKMDQIVQKFKLLSTEYQA